MTAWKRMTSALLLAIVLCFAGAVYAQQAKTTNEGGSASTTLSIVPGKSKSDSKTPEKAAVTQSELEGRLSLRKIFRDGGWVMYVIAALSFVALALIIFYLLTMRESVVFPKGFLMEAQDLAASGDLEGLRGLCKANACPAARIVEASLEQAVDGRPLDYERLRDAMEDEGARQAGFLWQRLQYLMDVAVIAPMVGLLGTVWGMMISFGGIESGADFAKKAETMANGISQAMYTTFGGLIVGIFAMALYDVFRGHLNRLVSAMESACGTVLRKLTFVEKGGRK